MANISAFTIIRNEELLIAKHLTELARHGDDVVCVVQPSTDCTLLFANNVAEQMAAVGLQCRIVEHTPPQLGKEFSLYFALEQCRHDWCFNLDADEAYIGRSPADTVAAASPQTPAMSIPRFQAVGCTSDVWFKTDPLQPKVRLVDRTRLPRDVQFDHHQGLERFLQDGAIAHVPASEGRIIEYKGPGQHYVDQLFYESQGVMNEAAQCRASMPPQALELGETAFRVDRRRWRSPR